MLRRTSSNSLCGGFILWNVLCFLMSVSSCVRRVNYLIYRKHLTLQDTRKLDFRKTDVELRVRKVMFKISN